MNKTTVIFAAAALACSSALAATAKLGQASSIELEGSSTMHAWKAVSRDFTVDLKVGESGQRLDAAIAARAPARMTVTVPVASLKSEHSGLDKNLRKALKAGENRDIVFALDAYQLAGTSVTAAGRLTVAGVTRQQTLNGALSWKDGRAIVDGEQPLLMTDFGVEPPAIMMGAVKTGDRVVVRFHLELEQP